jgi:hypothetical protein
MVIQNGDASAPQPILLQTSGQQFGMVGMVGEDSSEDVLWRHCNKDVETYYGMAACACCAYTARA